MADVDAMYAVIKTGGKQYRVMENDLIQVERLTAEKGSKVEFVDVMMVGNGDDTAVGTPIVPGAKVIADVVEQVRAPKILVFKKKRRKNYRRLHGHRQDLTVLRITDILPDGEKKTTKSKPKGSKATDQATQTPGKIEGPSETDKQSKPKARRKSTKPQNRENKDANRGVTVKRGSGTKSTAKRSEEKTDGP